MDYKRTVIEGPEAQRATHFSPVGAEKAGLVATLADVDANRNHGLSSHHVDVVVGLTPKLHQTPTASLVMDGFQDRNQNLLMSSCSCSRSNSLLCEA